MGRLRYGRVLCLVLGAIILAAPPAVCAQGIQAISRPSGDVTLAFTRPGRIAKVQVRPGDRVKAGQVLVRLDDQAEQAQLAQLAAQATNTLRIEAAEAQLARTREDLKQIETAAQSDAATALELTHARLDVRIAELSLALARFEHQQDQLRHSEAQLHVSRMQIESPLSGLVEKVAVEVGESVDELEDVVQVVQIDPLWIDVPVPLDQGRQLALGRTARVIFPGSDQGALGRVIHAACVADAASNTLTVRVEVPNPGNRPAGEHVQVSFSAASKPSEPPKERFRRTRWLFLMTRILP